MPKISEIPGLTAPGENLRYRNHVTLALWDALHAATRDDATGQSFLLNEDIVLALVDIQAMIASSSSDLSSPTRVREWSGSIRKELHRRMVAAQKATAGGASIFDQIIDLRSRN